MELSKGQMKCLLEIMDYDGKIPYFEKKYGGGFIANLYDEKLVEIGNHNKLGLTQSGKTILEESSLSEY